uniref:Uncharacterized protein n=1 Tax=Megaselia scalaris TaxID=36166 RepID=T1H169_MEGSC
MSSREVDYEKQFKDDLEKATALSLETLALEEFRRSKLGYISPAETQKFTLNYRSQIQSATTTNYQPQTAATSPPRPENDLISFSSPTVKQPKSEDENPTLKFLKDLNQQYNSQPATPQGMQLVPYFPSAQQTPPNNQIQLHQQQQQRLTNEELQKLYSMPPPQTMPQYTPNVFPAPFRQTVPSVVPTTVPVPASYCGYYGFVVPQPQQQLYTSHHPMQPQLHQQQQQPQTMFPQPAFQPLSSEKALVLRTSSPVPATGPAQSLQQSIPGTSIQRSNSGSSISLAASMPSSAAAQVNAEMKRKLSKKQSSIVKDDLIDLGVDE